MLEKFETAKTTVNEQMGTRKIATNSNPRAPFCALTVVSSIPIIPIVPIISNISNFLWNDGHEKYVRI